MQYDYIIELLNFQDKDLVVDKIEANNVINIYVHKDILKSDKCCKHCGSINFRIKDYYCRDIKFLDIAGFKSIIKYNQRRFICMDCKKSFNENCGLVKKGSTISNATKIKLLEETRKKQSFKDIANRLSISPTTVNNEFVEHISNYRCKLTEVLCIDEFRASTIAGEYALIFGDPITGKILDVLPSRRQDYIYYYFQTIPDEERFKVKYVVTDLFESYKTICETLFWKSIHIADRFHWIRQTTEAFNKTRIRIMNAYLKLGKDEFKGSYNKYTKYANILKKYHKLLLANKYAKEGWFFDQKEITSYLQKEMTFQEVIEYCINMDGDLEEAYELLQSLYKLAKYSNYENAKKEILDWCDRVDQIKKNIPEFKKVALTYRHWINPIVNSFIFNPITKSRMTNGFIEGKNNFCKVIKRIGFGQNNFDVFRAKILYTNDVDRPFKN